MAILTKLIITDVPSHRHHHEKAGKSSKEERKKNHQTPCKSRSEKASVVSEKQMGAAAGLRGSSVRGGHSCKCDPAFTLRLKGSGENGFHKVSFSQLAKTEIT